MEAVTPIFIVAKQYVSGVTDYDTFVATTTHAGGSANTVFVNSNAQNQPNGVVELFGTFALNLGSAQRVDAFAIWNSGNRPDMLIDFELYADTDGNFANGGTTLLGDYSIDATNTAITLPFPVTTGQFFHIRLTGHDGTDFLLLGEFAFRESFCPADFSGDGAVDATDLAILLAAWSSEGATDLNSDGVTNAADLAILLAAWGMCPQ